MKTRSKQGPRRFELQILAYGMIAAADGKLDRVKGLLAKGANANAHLDSVEKRKTPLTEAAKADHVDIVRILLAAGAEVDKPVGERLGTLNQTALMLAAQAGHANVVETLLSARARINATDTLVFGGGGNTPLHYAAMGGKANESHHLATRCRQQPAHTGRFR